MRNVAIIEDNEEDAKLLNDCLARYGNENNDEFHTFVFPSAELFLTNYKAKYDVVFMDVELPGIDGIEASKKLRELDSNVLLVLITSMSRFAVDGYSVGAFDFILKPVSYPDFFLKFTRIIRKIKSNDDIEILIKGKETTKRVSSNEIMYIEVLNHTLIYHLTDTSVTISGSMKALIESLKGKPFVQCNQSYLVNLKYVSEFNNSEVKVGEDWLTISRPKKKEFLKAVNLYFTGGK